MTDTMTPEQRHRCMSHIKGSGTNPELKVRRWLWNHGYRYRLNVRSVPGKPDIVLRAYRTAIFVNGCFWHGHGLTHSPSPSGEGGDYFSGNSVCCKIPTSNREFWVNKIRRNQERDQQNYNILYKNGWHVMVIWECQLTASKIEHTMHEVEVLLEENMLALYKKHTPLPYSYDEESTLPMAAEETV